MHCPYFAADRCRSCSWIERPYEQQLAAKQAAAAQTLPMISPSAWLPIQASRTSGFRNKAKMAASGAGGRLQLGLALSDGRSEDLRHCPLYSPALQQAINDVGEWLDGLGISPYSIAERKGELKYVIVTIAPDGALMVRLVLRSHHWRGRLAAAADRLLEHNSAIKLLSVNIHPTHAATIAGNEEHLIVGNALPMVMGGIELHLPPESFFQTNTEVAYALYRQVQRWARGLRRERVLDLFCGIGGFALFSVVPDHTDAAEGALKRQPASNEQRGRVRAVGVEIDPIATEAANYAAYRNQLPATFITADATAAYAQGCCELGSAPDFVIVNPPRRGIGALAAELNQGGPEFIAYSSCNPSSLAKDLERMPNYRVARARLFDMFPGTEHVETACLMTRAK